MTHRGAAGSVAGRPLRRVITWLRCGTTSGGALRPASGKEDVSCVRTMRSVRRSASLWVSPWRRPSGRSAPPTPRRRRRPPRAPGPARARRRQRPTRPRDPRRDRRPRRRPVRRLSGQKAAGQKAAGQKAAGQKAVGEKAAGQKAAGEKARRREGRRQKGRRGSEGNGQLRRVRRRQVEKARRREGRRPEGGPEGRRSAGRRSLAGPRHAAAAKKAAPGAARVPRPRLGPTARIMITIRVAQCSLSEPSPPGGRSRSTTPPTRPRCDSLAYRGRPTPGRGPSHGPRPGAHSSSAPPRRSPAHLTGPVRGVVHPPDQGVDPSGARPWPNRTRRVRSSPVPTRPRGVPFSGGAAAGSGPARRSEVQLATARRRLDSACVPFGVVPRPSTARRRRSSAATPVPGRPRHLPAVPPAGRPRAGSTRPE